MSHTIYKQKIHRLISLYEYNYRRLCALVPALADAEGELMLRDDTHVRFSLQITEQCKYTTMLALKHYFDHEDHVVDMELNIRVSHDAAVAEVVSYQHHGRLEPVYEYPNAKMYHKDEKYQHNRLLADWLNLCADRQYVLIKPDSVLI
ncbi:MAG: DUF1249 domain-containing protein [Gammaproteobacteria bacterium]|nr:DUF1249 domain-containing protein [Gammaproteobacteria bacterium]MDH5594876.1 DUF1249 domain-containing protein [Gammaproteobacteria bacterium]MDH5614879.1 DUF1249 domain-containing protein [Gammaproteobacteria bacterium]